MNDEPLIVCLDVDYRDDGAMAAGLWFRGWESATSEHVATQFFSHVAPYEPGAFFRRELPCLLAVLAKGPEPAIVIVDGYVQLGDGKPGLGAYLHEAIGRPVIGIAKTQFTDALALRVLRGGSGKPLFVSAIGLSDTDAAERVHSMHGPFRIPTLIKQVDGLARSTPASTNF